MEKTVPKRPRMIVTGSMNSNDSSTPQTGTSSSTQFSRISTILTLPDSPTSLSTSLHEKSESIANQERERQSFGSNDSIEVPAWDRSGSIPTEDGLFEDPLALEWQRKFWDRSDATSPKFTDDNGEIVKGHQATEWGKDFIDESPCGDYDTLKWGGDFIEEVTGNQVWDVFGVTDPRYTFAEGIVDLSAWDVSGVTDPKYLVAQFWDKSGFYLSSSADLIEEENMRVNESAILSQHYLDLYRNPPNIHKLTYYLETFPNELEFYWQQYLIQSVESQDGMVISESAHLETFKQFVDQLELSRRDFGRTSFSLAPFPDESDDVDSFYSAGEEQTTHAELFKPRPLSELIESGRRSIDDFQKGRTSERQFVISQKLRHPHSLDDIIVIYPSIRSRKNAQMEEDLPSLDWIVKRRPNLIDGGFHFSIEPCMSGGHSPGNSRSSSRSSEILPAGDDIPVLQQMNTEAGQTINRMASKRSGISKRNSRESKDYKPSMDRLIQPSINYIPSLGELKERPTIRRRFDKFRNKMKFWRSMERSDDA